MYPQNCQMHHPPQIYSCTLHGSARSGTALSLQSIARNCWTNYSNFGTNWLLQPVSISWGLQKVSIIGNLIANGYAMENINIKKHNLVGCYIPDSKSVKPWSLTIIYKNLFYIVYLLALLCWILQVNTSHNTFPIADLRY